MARHLSSLPANLYHYMPTTLILNSDLTLSLSLSLSLSMLLSLSLANFLLFLVTNCVLVVTVVMDLMIRGSSKCKSNSAVDVNMVSMELEAAEALAGLARFPTSSKPVGGGSVPDRLMDNDGDNSVGFHKCSSDSSYEHVVQETTNNIEKKKPKKAAGGILSANSVKNEEQSCAQFRVVNPSCPTKSTGRKSRLNLTEAEMEARKIRRVLANRESARQTIRRRQAVFEELTRKAVDLARENENLKKKRETTSKQYDSLKIKNQCLKEQVAKIISNEGEETREESTTNEPAISTTSTNSSYIIYNQPSFLPFVWPSPVQLQCGSGSSSGIGFLPNPNSLTSTSCEEGSSIYLLPYPCLVTLPQNTNENLTHPHSFNLNDKPKESMECQQFFPETRMSETPTNNTDSVSCEELLTKVGDNKIHQVPVVCSGKRLGDAAAATEARKKRKQLTRLKNHFHCRQLRMH